jgi:hypothetical protein
MARMKGLRGGRSLAMQIAVAGRASDGGLASVSVGKVRYGSVDIGMCWNSPYIDVPRLPKM